MIRPGSTITLRPFYTFKGEPEKDQEFIEAFIKEDRVLYFQVLDKNRDPTTGKSSTGFCNVRIVTNAELHAWDRVKVKEIKGVKLSRGKPQLVISIIEAGEKYIPPKKVTGFDKEEEDF